MPKPKRHDDILRENWFYYVGDTFQFWTGPLPEPGEPQASAVRKQIENSYISCNLIKECIDRHVAGMIGQMPHWYLHSGSMPVSETEGDRSQIATDGEKLLTDWLEQMLTHSAMLDEDADSNPLVQAVTQAAVTGRGYLRLYQPKKYKDVPDTPFYNKIRLHCPLIGSVRVERDDDGEIEEIVYSGNDTVETQILDPISGELSYSVVRQGGESDSWVENFGGNWTIFELRMPVLITRDIKRLQNALNKDLTMLGRNLDLAGFLERIITNAQMPGEWIEDPKRPGKQKFVPNNEGIKTGPGKTLFLSGLRTESGLTTPGVSYRSPVDISTFERAIKVYVERMYHSFNQGHLLASGDGNISGVSRVQLREDANLLMERRALVVERVFASVLEVVLRFQDPGMFKDIHATTKLRKSLNYVTPEEKAEIRNNYQSRLISRTTAMSQLGIENPDAEAALIDEELAEAALGAAIRLGGLGTSEQQ